jgi:hypothetical protein
MPNPIRQAFAGIPKTVNEALVKPTQDEASKMMETGATNLFGTTPTPAKTPQQQQAEAAKKAEDQKKVQNILRYFDSLKANAAQYKQQQDTLKTQKQQEELAKQQEIRQFEIQKKQKQQERVEVFRAQRKSEIKVKGG